MFRVTISEAWLKRPPILHGVDVLKFTRYNGAHPQTVSLLKALMVLHLIVHTKHDGRTVSMIGPFTVRAGRYRLKKFSLQEKP